MGSPRLGLLLLFYFSRIIQALVLNEVEGFQDLRYIGELRQRWEEIKKLQSSTTSIPLSV